MKKGVIKFPNHEEVDIPIKVIKTSKGPNRKERRGAVAFERQLPGKIKKMKIKLSHDATHQRRQHELKKVSKVEKVLNKVKKLIK